MNRTFLALTLASAVFAQEPPAAPTLAKYWKTVAEHFAAVASFEAKLTPEQKAARRDMEAIDKRLAEARAALAATCGKDQVLDESGPDPVCKAK